MTLHFNRHVQLDQCRTRRNNATASEQRLWARLEGQQVGAKFRRQHSVDQFVVDLVRAIAAAGQRRATIP